MIRLCSKCKTRPAVVFVSEMSGSATKPKGLCIICAKELGIKPINDMLEKMNITDEDLELMSEQFMDLMPISDSDGEDDDGDSFQPGGAATFPFLNSIFGMNNTSEKNNSEKEKNPKTKTDNKKKKSSSKNADLSISIALILRQRQKKAS